MLLQNSLIFATADPRSSVTSIDLLFYVSVRRYEFYRAISSNGVVLNPTAARRTRSSFDIAIPSILSMTQ